MKSEYLVELTTVQGSCLRFGPYSLPVAQAVVDDFQHRVGSDEMVFSPAVNERGRPVGAWAMAARGIALVRLVPSSANSEPVSGRLQRPRWSRPLS
jgi:hypothetical protein